MAFDQVLIHTATIQYSTGGTDAYNNPVSGPAEERKVPCLYGTRSSAPAYEHGPGGSWITRAYVLVALSAGVQKGDKITRIEHRGLVIAPGIYRVRDYTVAYSRKRPHHIELELEALG
jgi:hypothetical protein